MAFDLIVMAVFCTLLAAIAFALFTVQHIIDRRRGHGGR